MEEENKEELNASIGRAFSTGKEAEAKSSQATTGNNIKSLKQKEYRKYLYSFLISFKYIFDK